jgi:hypothetical protein
MSKQLIVIDPRVANYQSLIDQLGAAYSYLLLSLDSDGVTQIASHVAANPGFDAIHLISHGSPGQVAVGTSTLSEATIAGYTAQLNQIGASLNAGGDLLIYGCDVAQGVGGQQLITDLSRLTRLDVAASTNRTGSTGDWVLESATDLVANSLPEVRFVGDLAAQPSINWTKLIRSLKTRNEYYLEEGL